MLALPKCLAIKSRHCIIENILPLSVILLSMEVCQCVYETICLAMCSHPTMMFLIENNLKSAEMLNNVRVHQSY